jgi:hypothetical protein
MSDSRIKRWSERTHYIIFTRIVDASEQWEHPPLLDGDNLLGRRHTAQPRVNCSHVVALLYDREPCVDTPLNNLLGRRHTTQQFARSPTHRSTKRRLLPWFRVSFEESIWEHENSHGRNALTTCSIHHPAVLLQNLDSSKDDRNQPPSWCLQKHIMESKMYMIWKQKEYVCTKKQYYLYKEANWNLDVA